jgi:pilus assembly protein Flp/PilA
VAARLAVRFWRCESGATAIEYGLILGLIFLVIVGAVTTMMGSTNNMFVKINTAVMAALN